MAAQWREVWKTFRCCIRLLLATIGLTPSLPLCPCLNSVSSVRAIGLWFGFDDVPLDPDIRSAIESAAETFRTLGYRVESIRPKGLERARELWWFFFERVFAPFTRELIRGRENEAHWSSTDLMYEALEQPEPTAREIISNLIARDQMRTMLLEQMEQLSDRSGPVCTVTAPLHHTLRGPKLHAAMSPSSTFNLLRDARTRRALGTVADRHAHRYSTGGTALGRAVSTCGRNAPRAGMTRFSRCRIPRVP